MTSSLGKIFRSAFTSGKQRRTLSKAIQKCLVHVKLKRLHWTLKVIAITMQSLSLIVKKRYELPKPRNSSGQRRI